MASISGKDRLRGARRRPATSDPPSPRSSARLLRLGLAVLRRLPILLSSASRPELMSLLARAARLDVDGLRRHVMGRLRRIDGYLEPLPLVDLDSASSAFDRNRAPILPLDEPVHVIVPIFNGYEFLPPLFDSLENNTSTAHRLTVIDDGSSDPRIWPWLCDRLESWPHCRLLRNERNRGYPESVNRAAKSLSGHVVLLNSDTEVPPGWLERLMAPILRDPTVGSATPFSNAATICSLPLINNDNPLLEGATTEAVDEILRLVRSDTAAIEIPTGVGFCMALSRHAIERVGLFDAEAFGRGYGEENDWCMRARRAGFRHLLVPNLFVHHHHGGSFPSTERTRLAREGLAKVARRYPEYLPAVREFIDDDPARGIRAFAWLLLLCSRAAAPPVLIVDHRYGGGALLYRESTLLRASRGEDRPTLVVTYDRDASRWRLSASWRAHSIEFSLTSIEVLEKLVEHVSPDLVVLNSVATHRDPIAVLETILLVCSGAGARLVVPVHDFHAVCPSYNLIDESGRYCGIPEVKRCRECLPANDWAGSSTGRDIDLWRATWKRVLSEAERVVCFSEDSRRLLARAFPEAIDRVSVEPHELPPLPSRPEGAAGDRVGALHIGVVGAINHAKGSGIVVDLAREIERTRLDARITVIGTLDRAVRRGAIRLTGAYERAELPKLVANCRAQIYFVPSIWPETFSYVTSELIALGVPVCCFDLGAQAERVREYSRGRVIRRQDPAGILAELEAFRSQMAAGPVEPHEGSTPVP